MKKFAMVFPGQGSQSVGMLADLAKEFPIVTVLFQQASDVLGYDLWDLVQNGPAEKLNQTEMTQPALLVADVAVFECWRQKQDVMPAYLAGHSLGEYAALVCAGALTFIDAVTLVANRGRYMQAAVKPGDGAMAAIIGLDNDQIAAICKDVAEGDVVSPANYNSLGQTVISGHKAAVERAVVAAKTAGAKIAKLIPVSVPSHCELMQPAADKLAQDLKQVEIIAPLIPVIHNMDVSEHQQPDRIRAALVGQLTQPVRWVESIETLVKHDVEYFLECGPGKVLAGLNKRIVREVVTHVMNSPELLDDAVGLLSI